MAMEGSLAWPRRRSKKEVYQELLRRLTGSPCAESIILSPIFNDQLWAHFDRLPTKYSLDVNLERPEDVLIHIKLLQLAHSPAYRPAFEIRAIHAIPDYRMGESGPSNRQEDPQCSSYISSTQRHMHEIIFSSDDKPKLLSQLTSLLAELDLNIQEAHAFSTTDGYSLALFLVDSGPYQDTDLLRMALQRQVDKAKNQIWIAAQSMLLPKVESLAMEESASDNNHVRIPVEESDVWEIDPKLLKMERKVASSSYGDIYRGTYCSQDVAIKIVKPELLSVDMLREFGQEIYIMRKVRHKNVVRFIGACTKPPILCTVTEFMHGGSVYDIIHNEGAFCNFSAVLKIAIDVAKGMNYLHQCNIIHRDLKSANLLMDEIEVVKVADFGVARVKDQTGVMTAETGTYRWMAPEVIEHKKYDQKADVFSFSIVLWELLTRKLPYEELTPLQAAVAIVQKGLRPAIPMGTHPKLIELLERCWQYDPSLRPGFPEILDILYHISKKDGVHLCKSSISGRFFSSLVHGK